MNAVPKWAQELTVEAVIYLQSLEERAELPEIVWRRTNHLGTSGICRPTSITINAGSSRLDTKLTLLHELAHWALPTEDGHENHTPRFWDLAWKLYRQFKLPIRYCLKREQAYRKGAAVAYHRSTNILKIESVYAKFAKK